MLFFGLMVGVPPVPGANRTLASLLPVLTERSLLLAFTSALIRGEASTPVLDSAIFASICFLASLAASFFANSYGNRKRKTRRMKPLPVLKCRFPFEILLVGDDWNTLEFYSMRRGIKKENASHIHRIEPLHLPTPLLLLFDRPFSLLLTPAEPQLRPLLSLCALAREEQRLQWPLRAGLAGPRIEKSRIDT